MKVDFIDDDHLVVYYFYDEKLRTEEEMRIFFKVLDKMLIKKYDYEFRGTYDVNVYCKENLLVLDFKNVDDFGRKDFDITMFLNSVLLFEFEDFDFYSGNKVYYNDRYYIELDDVIDDIRLFEFGNIIYGDKVDEVLDNGKLISI